MKIDSTLIASTGTELRGLPLKTGQRLAAIVLQANQSTGKALLSLAGGQLTVTTRQPLATGSAIQLTVKAVGPPLVLGLTPSPGENMATKSTLQTPVQTLISLLMSRLSASSSSSTLISMLKTDANPAQGSQTNTISPAAAPQPLKLDLPLSLRMALPNLDPVFNALRAGQPSPTLNPMQSGKPITEETLARSLTQLIVTNSLPVVPRNASPDHRTSDIKSQLRLAAQQIKTQAHLESLGKHSVTTSKSVVSAPSTQTSTQATAIQSSLEQWISRLDVSQLRSAILQIQGQPTWVVDVPMMLAEQPRRVQIAIQEQSQNTNPPTESTWQLDFAIELPSLGPLHGSLSLQSTDLTVRLYADNPEARIQLDASLDQLKEHLRAASLTPKELSIYPGPPPEAVQERLSPGPILDDHGTFSCRV